MTRDADEPTPPAEPDTTADSGAERSGGAAAGTQQQTLWPEGTQFGRRDKIAGAWLAFATVFNLAMLPARPVLLGLQPLLLVTLTGSRTGMVACGALAATGQAAWWPLALVLGTASLVKFHWIYWWAGRLWGDWFIASMTGPGKRARRNAARAEAVTRKYDYLAMFLTFIPFVPIPAPIVYALLGTSGTRLRRFLFWDVLWAIVLQATYFGLGWRLGEPAVAVLDEFAKYSWWLMGAIILFMVVGAVRASRQEAREGKADGQA